MMCVVGSGPEPGAEFGPVPAPESGAKPGVGAGVGAESSVRLGAEHAEVYAVHVVRPGVWTGPGGATIPVGSAVNVRRVAKSVTCPFKEQRKNLDRRLRAAVREVNSLLAMALESNVMVTVEIDGRPRHDVAVYGYEEQTAVVRWAVRLRAITGRKRLYGKV